MENIIKGMQNFILRQAANITKKRTIGSHSEIRHTMIGEYVSIGKYCNVNASDIGKGTYLGDYCRIPFCKIGKFTSIASGVTLGAGSHPKQFVSMHPAIYSGKYHFNCGCISKAIPYEEMTFTNETKKFYYEIGNDVWIGTNVLLISKENSVKIGDGAVLGGDSCMRKCTALCNCCRKSGQNYSL